MRDLDNQLEAGFQLATLQGPLCSEPVEGLAYFVESVEMDSERIEQERCMSHTLRDELCINISSQYTTACHRSLERLLLQ